MTTFELVDFHCHLDMYPDPVAVVRETEALGIMALAVTTTPYNWPRNKALTAHSKSIYAALGLHPQLMTHHEEEIALWDTYLGDTRYIGEVGLDAGPRFRHSLETQKRVFQHILQRSSAAGDKILSVHSVRTATMVLDYTETFFRSGKVVLHWFTGSQGEAKRAVKQGCYFSINTIMMKSERHLATIKTLPINRILTETDGPSTMTEGRPSKPADVSLAVAQLALLHNLPTEKMAMIIRQNVQALLG